MSDAAMTALAAAPILLVLVLMVGAHWSGARAGAAGWGAAVAIAVLAYGAGPSVVAWSQAEAVFTAVSVLAIIWAALALSHVVAEAGALSVVTDAVARLTSDRTMQLLILAWVFASFIQGVTGFGVPAAVVAPLLVGLGFPAITAVVATSIGHAWAVTFGSLGSSVVALVGVTGLPASALGPPSAMLLGLACVLCGMMTAHAFAGWRSLRHALAAVLLVGTCMAATQYYVAGTALWNLSAFVASVAGLAMASLVTRLPMYRAAGGPNGATDHAPSRCRLSLPWAVSGYVVLLAVVLAAQLVPGIAAFLDRATVSVQFPETSTSLGWVNPESPPQELSVLGCSGALIAYSALVAYFVYRRKGCYSDNGAMRVARATVRSAGKPSLGILLLVGMALAMEASGMTHQLAEWLGGVVGGMYPLAAPSIGALGAFMTGTNTHSNVVFGALQLETARRLGMNELVILGGQNVGGAVGSVFAPAKVVVACAAVGIAAREGEVLRRNFALGLVVLAVTGAVCMVAVAVLPHLPRP